MVIDGQCLELGKKKEPLEAMRAYFCYLLFNEYKRPVDIGAETKIFIQILLHIMHVIRLITIVVLLIKAQELERHLHFI